MCACPRDIHLLFHPPSFFDHLKVSFLLSSPRDACYPALYCTTESPPLEFLDAHYRLCIVCPSLLCTMSGESLLTVTVLDVQDGSTFYDFATFPSFSCWFLCFLSSYGSVCLWLPQTFSHTYLVSMYTCVHILRIEIAESKMEPGFECSAYY